MSASARTSWATVLAAGVLTSGCGGLKTVTPTFEPTLAPPPASESRVTLPIEIEGVDLSVLDKAVKPVFGGSQYEGIPVWGGAQVNYMVWRDPIMPSLTDATVSMQVHPYFFLSIGDAYDPDFQCGFRHETAQERLIGMTSRVTWHPQWALQAAATSWTFLPVTPPPQPPMLRCTLGTGPWEYDAEWMIDGILTDRINELTSELNKRIKDKTNIRQSAVEFWNALRATIDVPPDLHVQLRPGSVAAGPITSTATGAPGVYNVRATVEIKGRPRLVVGSPPEADTTPLPDVTGEVSGEQGFVLNFEAEYPFAEANRTIGASFPIVRRRGKYEVVLRNPVLRPSGERVILELELLSRGVLWRNSAKIYLIGKPEFDCSRRCVAFPDLDYTLETRSVLAKSLEWLLHDRVIDEIKPLARLDFGKHLDRVAPALNRAMNRQLGDARLSGHTDEVRPDELYVTDRTILARTRATGELSMVIGLERPQR